MAKVLGVVGPTFSPKPRSTPRRLISTSWRLACRSLRVVRRARTSWAGSDLQCTGAEPAQAHQLGDAAGVLAIGLDQHGLEGRAYVPRLEQLNRQAGRLHLGK